MNTELIEVSPTRREIKIEIEAAEVREVYNKVSQKFAKQAQIDGFRKGFAPVDVVRMRYKDQIQSEVLQELFSPKVSEAIQKYELNPLAEPHLKLEDAENLKANGSQAISLSVEVEVMPAIPTPEYKNLEVIRRARPLSDEELDDIIDERRQESATLLPVEDRKSETGDTVIVDLEGAFVGEDESEPIRAADLEIKLGDEKIEKSFTENLVGVEEDEEKEFTVSYAEDFTSPMLAGKTVNYKAKIKSVGAIELPDLDDEWAASLDEGFESLQDLREQLRGDLEASAKDEADNRLRAELIQTLIEAHEFEVPDALVDIQARNLLNNFAQDMAQRGMDLNKVEKDFIQMVYTQMQAQAERDVRGAMLLEKVAELENVEISDDEINEEIEKMAQNYRTTPEEIRASLSQQGGEANISNSLRTRKAVEALVVNAKITDGEWIDPNQPQVQTNKPSEEELHTEKLESENENSQVKSVEIQCINCEKWFPSPIGFGGSRSFDTASLWGNIVSCPFCGKMTECNKDNMRVLFEDGGFLGNKAKVKKTREEKPKAEKKKTETKEPKKKAAKKE